MLSLAMLVHDFVEIDAPFPAVREQLCAFSLDWLSDQATEAYAKAERLSFTVKPGVFRLSKRVQLDVGTPYPRDDGIVLPVHWWAVGATRLFPTLEADLIAMPVGSSMTQITLMGHYEPPLGPVGRGLDRLVLHRVAEMSVRSFLQRLGSRLTSEVAVCA